MSGPPHDPATDPVVRWRAAADRVCDLVLATAVEAPGALERRVPACPGWTSRELLAHVVGLAADVLAGDEPEDHDPAWTQRQVDARAAAPVIALVEEWRALADDLVTWMRENGSRPLNDVVIHEQDLRGALGRPGARDTSELALVRDRLAGRLGRAVAGLPPLELVAPGWRWRSHAGDAEDGGEPPGTRLEASGFDLARAVASRRTADQLAAWTVRGDVAPYLPAFAGLGDLPREPLPE